MHCCLPRLQHTSVAVINVFSSPRASTRSRTRHLSLVYSAHHLRRAAAFGGIDAGTRPERTPSRFTLRTLGSSTCRTKDLESMVYLHDAYIISSTPTHELATYPLSAAIAASRRSCLRNTGVPTVSHSTIRPKHNDTLPYLQVSLLLEALCEATQEHVGGATLLTPASYPPRYIDIMERGRHTFIAINNNSRRSPDPNNRIGPAHKLAWPCSTNMEDTSICTLPTHPPEFGALSGSTARNSRRPSSSPSLLLARPHYQRHAPRGTRRSRGMTYRPLITRQKCSDTLSQAHNLGNNYAETPRH